MIHMQKAGWNHCWAPGAVTKEGVRKPFHQLSKQQIKFTQSTRWTLKWSSWSVAVQMKWETHRTICAMADVPWTGKQVYQCTQWLGAGSWGLESNLSATTDDDCRETTQGDRREEIHGRQCLWKKSWRPWKQGAIAESCARSTAFPVASLSSHACTGNWALEKDPSQGSLSICWAKQWRRTSQEGTLGASCQRLEKNPNRAISPVPMTTGFSAHLAPPRLLRSKQLLHLHVRSSLEQTQVF